MSTTTPTPKLTKEEQKEKTLEANEAKEKIFLLVSKVISWKTQAKDSNSMQTQDRITPEEWSAYKKHLLAISKTESSEVVKEKIKMIFAAIENNGGFVD